MLYLVGLGLAPHHLTEEARDILSRADKVYLDTYTNYMDERQIHLYESAVGRAFIRATRASLEDGMAEIIKEARTVEVAVAVSGDPFFATTHRALYLEAVKKGVEARYIPGVSVLSVVVSLSGLQPYRFGPVLTVPHFWKNAPSFYEKFARNRRLGLHSLVLLDLHPEPLSLGEALEALIYWEKERKNGVIDLSTLVIGVARAGMPDCKRYVGTVEELLDEDWGQPPHSLVVPGKLDPLEEESLYTLRRYKNGEC